MRTASNWKDYVLLDAADGEKLEKWGGISLVRPDPLTHFLYSVFAESAL